MIYRQQVDMIFDSAEERDKYLMENYNLEGATADDAIPGLYHLCDGSTLTIRPQGMKSIARWYKESKC